MMKRNHGKNITPRLTTHTLEEGRIKRMPFRGGKRKAAPK